MEASLLPSRAVRALCKRTLVAAVRRDDPACEELRKEFAVPWPNSWVIVLDAKGETLDSWMGDTAGSACDEKSTAKFARTLVKLIDKSLAKTESIQELERRWKKNPRDRSVFAALKHQLQGMYGFSKLKQMCEEAASDTRLSTKWRDAYRIWAFESAVGVEKDGESETKARARFIREGEKLLIELAGNPEASGLVRLLFARGFSHVFDVPARSAEAIARLERAVRSSSNPELLRERIREFAEARKHWIDFATEYVKNIEDPLTGNFMKATLGDAQAAIDVFSTAPYSDIPDYQEWLRQARRKLERQRKKLTIR